MGLKPELLSKTVHADNKLAHYAKACTDITFTFPFGTQVCDSTSTSNCNDYNQSNCICITYLPQLFAESLLLKYYFIDNKS